MLMLGVKPAKGITQRHRRLLAAMDHADLVTVFETVKMLIEEQRRSIEGGKDGSLHKYLRQTIDWETAPTQALEYARKRK